MNPAPNLPAVIAGRYLPVRLIAKGGMGAVYEVEHVRTGEHLALKVLLSGVGASGDALERFKREARASARIKSEHVVRVIDADVAPELDGAPFLVMELLEGTDLERMATGERLDPASVVDWLRQVASAIDKAHRLGIVHRDLKPENIFLTAREDRRPLVKVLDFGIVKMTEEGTGATGSGQILGTPRYMAPEQVSSTERITPATDRYALGLVAYRLLTGESYYRGDPISILAQILHEPIRPPSERHPQLGLSFDAWFARACHRNPGERFASAAEQVEALAAALGLPSMAASAETARWPSGSAPGTDRVAVRRLRPVIGLAIAAALVGGTVAGVLLLRRSGPAPSPEARVSQGGARPVAPAAPPPATTPPTDLVDAHALPPVPPTIVAPTRTPTATESGHVRSKPRTTGRVVVSSQQTATKKEAASDPYIDQK